MTNRLVRIRYRVLPAGIQALAIPIGTSSVIAYANSELSPLKRAKAVRYALREAHVRRRDMLWIWPVTLLYTLHKPRHCKRLSTKKRVTAAATVVGILAAGSAAIILSIGNGPNSGGVSTPLLPPRRPRSQAAPSASSTHSRVSHSQPSTHSAQSHANSSSASAGGITPAAIGVNPGPSQSITNPTPPSPTPSPTPTHTKTPSPPPPSPTPTDDNDESASPTPSACPPGGRGRLISLGIGQGWLWICIQIPKQVSRVIPADILQ